VAYGYKLFFKNKTNLSKCSAYSPGYNRHHAFDIMIVLWDSKKSSLLQTTHYQMIKSLILKLVINNVYPIGRKISQKDIFIKKRPLSVLKRVVASHLAGSCDTIKRLQMFG